MHAEDLGYNNPSTASEEIIIDDVDDVNPVKELKDTSVNRNTFDHIVDPTPEPRVPELVDDPKSSANDDTDDGSPSDQDSEGTYRDRTTQHRLDLRYGLSTRRKYRNLYEREFQGLQKSEPREHTTADYKNEKRLTHMYRGVNRIATKEGCRHLAGKEGVPEDKNDVCLTKMSVAKGLRTFRGKSHTGST